MRRCGDLNYTHPLGKSPKEGTQGVSVVGPCGETRQGNLLRYTEDKDPKIGGSPLQLHVCRIVDKRNGGNGKGEGEVIDDSR